MTKVSASMERLKDFPYASPQRQDFFLNYHNTNLFQKLPKVNKDLAEKLLDAEDSILEKKTSKVILPYST